MLLCYRKFVSEMPPGGPVNQEGLKMSARVCGVDGVGGGVMEEGLERGLLMSS